MEITTEFGPAQLLSADFGYVVVSQTIRQRDTVVSRLRLYVYRDGSWRDATPRRLVGNWIDGVSFSDKHHGWLASYDCASAQVHLYRTTDGGTSWQTLGTPASHGCGGDPRTFLSFSDALHGWMEPTDPTGPGSQLYRTSDGGLHWTLVADVRASPPCIAPVSLVTPLTGWMARCFSPGTLFSTQDGGRRWKPTRIRLAPQPWFDLPRFFNSDGVLPATLATRDRPSRIVDFAFTTRSALFLTSTNNGRDWVKRSTRPLASCALTVNDAGLPDFARWPTSVASAHVWWIADGPGGSIQITHDAGRQWQTIRPGGLPRTPCSVTELSAANDKAALALTSPPLPLRGSAGLPVARQTADDELYMTRNGGRSWHRVKLPAA